MNKNKKKKNNKPKRIEWKTIRQNRKLSLICLIFLILIIYCVYKVVALIKNPTDTFSVEQGKIYQEESTVRIYY